MLNERAYITSRRVALQWALGCALTAVRERVTYELERTLMSRRIKVLFGLGAALVMGAIGIYIDAKPYQRERIWMALRQATHSEQRQDLGRGNAPPASKTPDNHP
jgi:hypothetical protein